MKPFLFTLFCLLINSTEVKAQSLSGEYFIAASEGEIVLQLQVDAQNQVSGNMIDLQGIRYNIQGTQNENSASGTITNADGGTYFQAQQQGNELVLTLIPPGLDQQPDYDQAQEFIMTARAGVPNISGQGIISPTPNNAGGISGPLARKTETNWTGTYKGDISDTPAVMKLEQNGQQIVGQINAGGYIYNLNGNTTSNQSQGRVSDPQTNGTLNYVGTLQESTLILSLVDVNGAQFKIQFSKSGTSPIQSGDLDKSDNLGNTQLEGNINPAQLDQRITGNWLYTDSYTSGAYSFATQYRLIVKPDGNYLYGDGKVAGGGPSISGSSDGSGMTPGKWKTENGIIYINERYGWQAYAKYYVEGDSMMLTFGDGKKQIWKRSY